MASRVKSGQAKCLFCGCLHPIRQPCRNRECVAYIPTAAEARRIEEAKQDKNSSVANNGTLLGYWKRRIENSEPIPGYRAYDPICPLMDLRDDGEQD